MKATTPSPALYVWQHPGWPAWTYDLHGLTEVLSKARQQQGRVNGKAHAIGLAHQDLTRIVDEIWVREVIATAAIENQKLDLEEVRSSVMRKLGLGKSGHSSRNIDGLVDVMHDATANYDQPLDLDRICRWQSALFPGGTSGIKRIQTGQLRSFSEPMQIVSGQPNQEKVHFQAPESSRLHQEMTQFLDWFNRTGKIDGLIRAAISHIWFETIHPFEDGNGRLGRAIIDMAIAQETRQTLRLYSMSRQLQKNRSAYYDQLNAAQTGNLDITAWIYWFVTQFSVACEQSSLLIDGALEKANFWATHSHSEFNPRQCKSLQKLLEAGDGGFLGGLTAEKHVKITGASKATATRDLTDLVQKGALIMLDQGRASKYFINIPGWNKEENIKLTEEE